jgi:menaquinone-dependent protoporphyrinogen oxidase
MTDTVPERILIAFSTTDGHTPRICERMKLVMQSLGKQVAVMPLADVVPMELPSFERIVIGASIRYGHHQPQVAQFIAANQSLLESRPSAFFTVNIVARKPNKNTPETNPYLRKFLQRISWKPRLTGVFAGKLDYPRYGFFDRLMIRFIMLITKGPTDPKAVIEFTNWDAVEVFAREVCSL